MFRFPMITSNIVLGFCLVWAGTSTAFHDQGVAACQQCHVMHEDGKVAMSGEDALLLAGSATDLCLTCHAGDHGVLGNDPLNPPAERGAGNFVFLFEDNINDSNRVPYRPLAGELAGHSIISAEFGLGVDSRWSQSPGGHFPVSEMGCTSCHDPHGNDNFRMLNGEGPVQGGAFQFNYPAPVATGISVASQGETEGPGNHSAYQSGMSRWCANCHETFLFNEHHGQNSDFEHPTDERLDREIGRWYGNYNGTNDPEGGNPAFSYLPQVPFEDPSSTVNRTAGPTSSSRLMCLTCHRAHASSAPYAGRWDFNIHTLGQDGVLSGSYPLPNPYPGSNQQPLCYKCHEHGED